ncbi:aldo/keto reductase [Dyadobacter sandarakinus]|uniref:Aldo/keto reductase n=1 Tax=Dyadobacter sandarakinus TaxID=2747268 RepID=A0ABX7I117_9BACT|nr:aldo/keto reductase [Dyadobacter sandarakinus]QRQ99458.1 aldo/keto reductase [Dyadobacter sandarakinus]
MKKVELVKGIPSSALGFGCAPILGAVDGKTAKRIIDCALDCGISHFDLARSYGYGEAEEFVGKILKERRNEMTIASKFGIMANWKSELLKPLKPLVRYLRSGDKKVDLVPKKQPAPTGQPGKGGDMFHDRIPFRAADMRRSLEKSLRALGSDHLDYFFVHNPLEKLVHIDELSEAAQRLKEEGKIRAWGIAYKRSLQELHQPYLDRFDVLQFDNSVGVDGYDNLIKTRAQKPNIFFSPLRGAAKEMKPNEILQQLFTDFPNTVILCSMFNEKHLRENAKLVS